MQQEPARLLIVDDAADNRALLSRCFERRGHRCVEAQDGGEALELISRESFDLVLLDVVMPGTDGLTVLAGIRKLHSAIDLPVIMVTSKCDAADRATAMKSGANDYITKPVDLTQLRARVQCEIAARQKLQPTH
jgi:two-component system cell cycle response regulator